jgi:ADP-ribosylglycohydrolase
MEASFQDRCRGVLMGLAAGDRNGGPIQMAVRLAESLAERRTFDPVDVASRYLQWHREGAFDTGPISGRALELMASGMLPQVAAAQVHREFACQTAGCNPAHRSSPLAMLASIPDEDLARCAAGEAALTHQHPLAGDVATDVVVLCRALIRGVAWEIAVERAGDRRLPETQAALEAAKTGPGTKGGFSPEVLRAAVFFVGTSASFAEPLERSLAFAGPANYCPVLVGAIGGARWGSSAIPGQAVEHVDLLRRVRDTADALASEWSDR